MSIFFDMLSYIEMEMQCNRDENPHAKNDDYYHHYEKGGAFLLCFFSPSTTNAPLGVALSIGEYALGVKVHLVSR